MVPGEAQSLLLSAMSMNFFPPNSFLLHIIVINSFMCVCIFSFEWTFKEWDHIFIPFYSYGHFAFLRWLYSVTTSKGFSYTTISSHQYVDQEKRPLLRAPAWPLLDHFPESDDTSLDSRWLSISNVSSSTFMHSTNTKCPPGAWNCAVC